MDRLSAPQKSSRVGRIRQKTSACRVSAWVRQKCARAALGCDLTPVGLLKRATVDRVLRASGLDHARVTHPVAAVRFQAKRANELWHFDMSPSDLKQVEAPLWIEQGRGKPTLMLFSAVDDRSGAVYDEYRCVYGEDAEAALRFLFNAMAPKPEAELPFQGIPTAIYMDNGPVSRSKVFQSVMGSLGVRMLTHMPPSQADGSATECRPTCDGELWPTLHLAT